MEINKKNWVSFPSSVAFLVHHIRLLAWSLLLVAVTAFLTWSGYHETIRLVDDLVGNFFQTAPTHQGVWGWIIFIGWLTIKYLFLFISKSTAFYLAFLAAYCLTTPGYIFLSSSAEGIYLGHQSKQPNRFSPLTILIDLWEGLKIGAVGILITVIALALNFIPIVGQVLALLLYIFYSALMFIDYPASNKHWTFSQKINWLRGNRVCAFRLGILPALISMIPIINIIIMALFFPFFTVHTTLNFVEQRLACGNQVGKNQFP